MGKPRKTRKPTASQLPAKGKPRVLPVTRPTSEIALKTEHSYELVRTAINATIFQVVYTRQAFPDVSWSQRDFDPEDPNTSYDEFVAGTNAKAGHRGALWMVPTKGEVPEVDKLMDRLEVGVTDALQQQYLHRVQVSFHQPGDDPISELNLIELYAMTVHYEGDGVLPQINTEISVGRGDDPMRVTLLEGKIQVKSMLHKIVEILDPRKHRSRTPLPAECRMSMQLEYTSKAPLGYHPKSFHPGSEHTERLLDANIPEKEDYTMNTGFNSITFRCNLPEFLQLSQNSPIMPNLPRSTGSEFEMMLRNDCAVETRSNVQRSSSIFSASDGDPTQNEIVRQYQGVGVTRADHVATQDTQPLPMLPRLRPTAPITPASTLPAALSMANIPPYTQEIRQDVEARIEDMCHVAGDDDLDGPQGIDDGDLLVGCECGSHAKTESPIKCIKCMTLQHAECYGYMSSLPEWHLCYTCLRDLHPTANINPAERELICRKRKALGFFKSKRFLKKFDLLKTHLECSNNDIEQVLKSLVCESYIDDRRAHVNKSRKSDLPICTFTGDDERACREYLDNPSRGIDNVFSFGPGTPSPSEDEAVDVNGELAPDSEWSLNPPVPAGGSSSNIIHGLQHTGIRRTSTPANASVLSSVSPAGTSRRPLRNRSNNGPNGMLLTSPSTIGDGSTQGTPSARSDNQSRGNKRQAALSVEAGPSKRNRMSEMSPMVLSRWSS